MKIEVRMAAGSLSRVARAALAGAALLSLLAGAARADYLDDPRTARAVRLSSPRAPLSECLKVVSQAAGVELSAARPLGDEDLVGYVPPRPLRETMRALAELYDASWTAVPGAEPAYRLVPDPARAKATAAERAAAVQRYVRQIDDLAAEAARDVRALKGTLDSQNQQRLGLLIWSCLPAATRAQVLSGTQVTISVPAAQAPAIYRLALQIAEKADAPLTGPMLATLDLDDPIDTGTPYLRARVTAMRRNSLIAAIGAVDWMRPPAPPRQVEDPAGAGQTTTLPADIGLSGRFHGTRDELVLKVAEACNLPILSRQRSIGGTGPSIVAGGRKVADVILDLAAGSLSRPHADARGYQLLRSSTELFDSVARPPLDVVNRYLQHRPAKGEVVHFAQVVELAALTPVQLSALQRANLCSGEAGFVRDVYAILRLYAHLPAPQQEALFSPAGLDVTTLTHAQLHLLMDAKVKRGDWDIHGQLQELAGLRFRFREKLTREERTITFQAIRDERVVAGASSELPQVEDEERPTASRG